MREFTCPSCGAPVESRSAVAISMVCSYCQSLLVRQDLGLEYAGEKALLINDNSPFQVGTTGKIADLKFTLLGRARYKWEQGFWDEWFAWTDDGQICWLADAQGFLSFYRELQKIDGKDFNPESWEAGDNVKIGEKTWGVRDIKNVTLTSALGELPLLATQSRKSLSIDLVGDGDECATVEKSPDSYRVYIGKNYDMPDLHFENLKEISGW